MLAHTVADEPIVLDSDSRSEHGDDNLDNTRPLRTVGGEQLDHDTLDLDILAAPFKCSADKLEDGDNDCGDNGIDNNMFSHPAKRQRFALPRCEPNLHHTSTLPLPHNEDMESSTENADGNDSDESGEDKFLLKRQKLSDSLDVRTALSSHNRQPQHFPSSISEDPESDGADGSESISVDDNLASTAGTTPDVFESASVAGPQLCPEVTDTRRDWEVRKIIGKEYVDDVLHYLVEWCPTLEPVHSLEHAKELVEARLLVLHEDKGRKGLSAKAETSKRSWKPTYRVVRRR
jgi:hypothetical protein